MQVAGEIRIGEATAYARKAMAPITRAPWPLLMAFAAAAAAILAAVNLANLLSEKGVITAEVEPALTMILAGASVWAALRLVRGVTVRLFRRALLVRGVSDPLETAFRVTPQCLVWLSDGLELRADWRTVTDVLRAGPYWVALAQAHTLFVPRRFFVDRAGEVDFIRAMVERLEPAARARSKDAIRFLEATDGEPPAPRRRAHRLAAIALVLGAMLLAALQENLHLSFSLTGKAKPASGQETPPGREEDRPPDLEEDVIFGAQPGLMKAARAALAPRVSGTANVYAIAVAGSGSQALFSREAHEALRAAAAHFGGASRGGVLLSNGAVDLLHSPLATRAHIAAMAQAIGKRADPERDLVFLYLASHGSQAAALTSDLPNYSSVQPISAAATADALHKAGVSRRVIVISACYSGTWIPALADDNTIVITAAARDRTSFGCDDNRRFTVFGEAFLGSLAANNISLHDAFEDAKRKISDEERKLDVTPSLPQVFVGRNMQAVWMRGLDGRLTDKAPR